MADELTTVVNMTTAPPVPFLPESAHGRPILAVGGCWSGADEAGEAAIAPFRSLGTALADIFEVRPYVEWQQMLDPLYPPGVHNYFRSTFTNADDTSRRALLDGFARLPNDMAELHLQHSGGGVGRVPAAAIAVRDRVRRQRGRPHPTADGFAITVEWARRHLPQHHQLRDNLRTARLVLGHTRWATQGASTLDNASPPNAGDIIGTHNGDVTAPTRNGSTDSAWLFDQLNHAPTIKATAAVLTSLRVRAALAWTRRSRQDLVFLARTAPSPLATATDHAGAQWWASTPEWLRELERLARPGTVQPQSNPVPMSEGTLIVLRSDRDEITLTAHRRFTATSRPHDERLPHSAQQTRPVGRASHDPHQRRGRSL